MDLTFKDFMEDAETVEELKDEIRATAQFAIMTMEIYWEELEKSNLPEELKKCVLHSIKTNGGNK